MKKKTSRRGRKTQRDGNILAVFCAMAVLAGAIFGVMKLSDNGALPQEVANLIQSSPILSQPPQATQAQPTASPAQSTAPQETEAQESKGGGGYLQGLFGISTKNVMAMGMPVIYGVQEDLEDADEYWAMEDIQNVTAQGQTAQPTPDPNYKPVVVTDDRPKVMIYCSHSNEAYAASDSEADQHAKSWRTQDPSKNILRVAGVVASEMKNTYKIPVLFESMDHEQGKYYNTSYTRSLASIEKNQKKYSSLEVFIDIHRDAKEASINKNDYVMIDGKRCAKIMVVVGTGEGKTGNGFRVKPKWQENKKFADAITKELNAIQPGLAKQVKINTGRYNQHVSTHAVAIEVGYNKNTLQDALNSAPYLAKALAKVIQG